MVSHARSGQPGHARPPAGESGRPPRQWGEREREGKVRAGTAPAVTGGGDPPRGGPWPAADDGRGGVNVCIGDRPYRRSPTHSRPLLTNTRGQRCPPPPSGVWAQMWPRPTGRRLRWSFGCQRHATRASRGERGSQGGRREGSGLCEQKMVHGGGGGKRGGGVTPPYLPYPARGWGAVAPQGLTGGPTVNPMKRVRVPDGPQWAQWRRRHGLQSETTWRVV